MRELTLDGAAWKTGDNVYDSFYRGSTMNMVTRSTGMVTVVTLAQVVIAILPLANLVRALMEGGDMVTYLYPGIFSFGSLATGAVAFSVPLLGAYGLRKRKLWGWWIALLTSVAWLVPIMMRWRDIVSSVMGGELAAPTLSAGINLGSVILLLLPSVRRFYWQAPAVSAS